MRDNRRSDAKSDCFPRTTRSLRVSVLRRLLLPVLSRCAWQLVLGVPGDEDHRWVGTILAGCLDRFCISAEERSCDEVLQHGLLGYACCTPWIKPPTASHN